jgi:gliding motility-associated-like protein
MKKILMLLVFIPMMLFSQQPNDCVNSIISCGNEDISISVAGVGVQELNSNNSCSSNEHDSLWIKVTIEIGGTLGFTITPGSNAITEDYDFWVFGPNVTCANLGVSIRCSTTNPAAANQGNNLTGMNGSEVDTSEGPGADGNSFVQWLNVIAGETYYFVIDRPIGNSGFNLQWTGSASFSDSPQDNTPVGTNVDLENCDNDGDNLADFDLTQNEANMIGVQNVTASYHRTISDAQVGINDILTPNNYSSLSDTVFIRLTNNQTECFSVFEINLTVLANINVPQPPDLSICEINSDNIANFDLTQNNAIIIGSQVNPQVTYYTNSVDAQLANNPIATPNNFQNIVGAQQIWARLEDTVSGCFGTTSFIIEVFDEPIANPVSDWLVCDDDNDGLFNFDFSTTINPIILDLQSTANNRIIYYSNQTDADNDTNSLALNYTNTNAYTQETIFVRIENINNTDCYNTTSFNINVFDSPTANQINDWIVCDNDLDGDDTNGIVEFDLSNIDSEILGSQSSLVYEITYYETQNDADNKVFGLATLFQNTTANNQTIIVRIENRNNPACFDTTSLNLIINPLPTINNIVDYFQCDDDTDGFALINLEEINVQISTDTDVTFSYFLSVNDAINNTNAIQDLTNFSNTIANQVFCRVENQFDCFRVSTINLIVSVSQIPETFHLDFAICDDDIDDNDDTNGIATFNIDFNDILTQVNALFLGTPNISITFYENSNDALTEQNQIDITNNFRNENSPNSQDIFIRVDNLDNNSCVGLGDYITLIVNPLPDFIAVTPQQICTGIMSPLTAEIDNSANEYLFEWFDSNGLFLSTDQTINIDEIDNYTIAVTNTATQCQRTKIIEVTEFPKPLIRDIIIHDFNRPKNSVIIEIDGDSDYEYALDHTTFYTFEDDRDFQDFKLFKNLQPGEYTVTIRDLNSCAETTREIYVLDYPRFFTPNNDNSYDEWQINGIEFIQDASISIFDRYGKLLKQLKSNEKWDGVYNGKKLFENDFWFRVDFTDSKGKFITKKGHFSLILK